jgi:hypothetical protein
VKQPISFLYSVKLEQHLIFSTEKRGLFLVLFTTLRSFKDIMTIRYAFLMIFATDIPHFKWKNVIMIRTLSISRSTYLLKRRVSFLLITTGYTSHVLFFTTECCDFGDRQPCKYMCWYTDFVFVISIKYDFKYSFPT